MSKKVIRKWRESASLIILAKSVSIIKNPFDYKVLLFSRSRTSSYLPNYFVFPGGVLESDDESMQWAKYIRSIGISDAKINELCISRKPEMFPEPQIFATIGQNCLPRDISLRIAAIRETFEEVGVLICRDNKVSQDDNDGYARTFEDFDRKYWQNIVHNDPSQFLTLCQQLNVIPDLWCLHEWTVWRTPALYSDKYRYETAFYISALPEVPKLIIDKNEVINYMWQSPKEYLNLYPKLMLPWPQLYELCRLANFHKLGMAKKFAMERARLGTILLQGVEHQCVDGMATVLPGDSFYPTNSEVRLVKIAMPLENFRAISEKVHRYEYMDINDGTLVSNVDAIDGHLRPLFEQKFAKL